MTIEAHPRAGRLRGRPRITALLALLGALALVVATASCAVTREDDGLVHVEAAFHPLAFVAGRVGGDHVRVNDLTRGGVDVHHMELRARDIGAMIDADLVLHLADLQAPVDAAVVEVGDHAFDVGPAVDLVPLVEHAPDRLGDHDDGHDDHDDHGDGHDDHGHDDHGHEGHDHGDSVFDLHFWTDPDRMIRLTDAVADELARIDPPNADGYRANAADLIDDLTALSARFDRGLADCDGREIVVTHASFGYLAERFDLRQIPITGLVPSDDPAGSRLSEAVETIREHGIDTVFTEPLISSRIADAVAAEAGIGTAVLDPLEGVAADSDDDYLTIMDANLTALREGLRCR